MIQYNNIYDYISIDAELIALLDNDGIAWSIKPENQIIGILYKMISSPRIEGSDATWQRWRFTIEASTVSKSKMIANRLMELLHNIRGDVGGCLINYSFNIMDSDPELDGDTKRYTIEQDYRISTH